MKRFTCAILLLAVLVFSVHTKSLAILLPNAAVGSGESSLLALFGLGYLVGPTVDPTSNDFQAEEHIAIDPNNPNFLIAVVTDFSLNSVTDHTRRGSQATTKYAVSIDGGATWKDSFIPLFGGFSVTPDGRTHDDTDDPSVAIDRLGNVYLANLYSDRPDSIPSLYVSVSNVKQLARFASGHADGFVLGNIYPVSHNSDPANPDLNDKPWIAVDNSANPATAGNVYIVWELVGHTGFDIVFARSSDHGRTWSTPISLHKDTGGSVVTDAQVAVGPGGEVYVVWGRNLFPYGTAKLQFVKSMDGGRNFTRPVDITGNYKPVKFDSTYRTPDYPGLAVSPVDGSIYVAYADMQNKAGTEVEFIRSTDGGASFSAPTIVNDVSMGHQFMQAIAVDELGIIHMSWYDTRNSPNDSSNLDIYATFSTDGGVTFRPSARVTPSSFNVGIVLFIGDYAGIAAAGGVAHPVWTNIFRNADGSRGGGLQTSTLRVP